jgi:hypothetical protein
MSDVRTIALDRAIALLKAAGCKYAIVPLEGEPILQGVEIALPKERKKRTGSVYKFGELAKYYKSVLSLDADIGSVQLLPLNGYDANVLRGSISAWLSTHWGNKTYITNLKDDVLEILRVG